jgi:hypothetical protein
MATAKSIHLELKDCEPPVRADGEQGGDDCLPVHLGVVDGDDAFIRGQRCRDCI